MHVYKDLYDSTYMHIFKYLFIHSLSPLSHVHLSLFLPFISLLYVFVSVTLSVSVSLSVYLCLSLFFLSLALSFFFVLSLSLSYLPITPFKPLPIAPGTPAPPDKARVHGEQNDSSSDCIISEVHKGGAEAGGLEAERKKKTLLFPAFLSIIFIVWSSLISVQLFCLLLPCFDFLLVG